MQARVITLRFSSMLEGFDDAPLRDFIKDKEVHALRDHFFTRNDVPYLAVMVSYSQAPIGNLTSQYFANHYLGELDHFVKERLRVKGYLRYMDDFVFFGADKAGLRRMHATIRAFATERLRLELKDEATVIAPVSQGISFLGFRVFPRLVRLRGEKWRRFRHRVNELEKDWREGTISDAALARSVSSMLGHIRHADTLAARRKFLNHKDELAPAAPANNRLNAVSARTG